MVTVKFEEVFIHSVSVSVPVGVTVKVKHCASGDFEGQNLSRICLFHLTTHFMVQC